MRTLLYHTKYKIKKEKSSLNSRAKSILRNSIGSVGSFGKMEKVSKDGSNKHYARVSLQYM